MSTTQSVFPPAFPAPSLPPSNSSGRRALTIAGALFGVLGAIALTGGAIIGVATGSRSDNGYLTSDAGRITSDRYAVVVDDLDLHASGSDGFYVQPFLGTIQIVVDGSDKPVFVGIGRSDDVADYLDNVSHDEVVEITTSPFDVESRGHDGNAPVGLPGGQEFWEVTGVSTSSDTVLTWDVRAGDWSVVLMNADGSPRVDGYVSVGITLPVLDTIRSVLLWIGGSFLVISAVMLAGPVFGRVRQN